MATMISESQASRERLVELSRNVDRALAMHDRGTALLEAEQLLEALFAHHRALWEFRRRSEPGIAATLETAAVGMLAEVALAIGELNGGGRWPEPLLRSHVEQLIEDEADCGAFSQPPMTRLQGR